MAGHSRWAKVKHFKGGIDAKRGKIFAKLSKEIAIAVKIAGPDPAMNPRLRLALLKSRGANMPNDNVERAIKRGAGDDSGVNYEDLTYEVYGPHGVAILVELSTDNRNRTASEIRSICAKNGGSIAAAGAVTRLFHRKGHIIVARDAAAEDVLMEAALEAGAEDFKTTEHGYEVVSEPAIFEAVHKAVEGKGIKPLAAEVTYIPTLTVPLEPGKAVEEATRIIDLLEDHDDVKEVYSNAEFPE